MNSYNKIIHILVFIANLYLFISPIRVTELVLVLIADLYLFISPVGVIELILVPIADLYLFRSPVVVTRTTEVPVGTFRAETCILLYSYSSFKFLSYNYLTT